jgi:hypothetical protein
VGGRNVLDLFGDSSTSQAVREEVERDVRYANITVIEGIGASQYGIGMVSARLTEMILRDERAVIPVGCYNPTFGVTLSLPSVIGREGVQRVLEPEMSAAEQQGLQRSADAIKAALSRLSLKESRRSKGITGQFGTELVVSALFSYRAVLNSPYQSAKCSISDVEQRAPMTFLRGLDYRRRTVSEDRRRV